MMTSNSPLLLDTNVLVYAMDAAAPQHIPSRSILELAHSLDAGMCVVPQSLAEFYSLVTNPKRVATPLSPADALSAVESIAAFPGLKILPVPFDVVLRWIELCRSHPVKGARIYDLQIVAVMLANGVKRICTYDEADFAPFTEIKVEVPQ